MESKRTLALGSVLCVFAAAGIFLSIFSKLTFLPDILAEGVVLLLGIAAGIGTVLVVFNLTTDKPEKA
ncbi:MAG: hypothetical protein ACE5G1_04825 [bacterium]